MPEVLIVAATELELCGHPGLVCGVGPVEAAASTARTLAGKKVDAVLHIGLAGGLGLEPGTIVIGTEAIYCDLSAAIPVTRTVHPDTRLVEAAWRRLPAARDATIGTSASVGGPCNSLLQSPVIVAMEGFAVLRACQLAAVPAVEVRVISNEIGESDRSLWRIEDALAALAQALPGLIASITAAVSPSP